MRIIITGSAGFIGMHSSLRFLNSNFSVLGIDNLNNYYDRKLKLKRLELLKEFKKFKFKKIDISNFNNMLNAFKKFKPDFVLHLAAQAGVRHSITHPEDYTKSNLVGFANVLECSKIMKIKHLIFGSSSSVYGSNTNMPFSVHQNVDHPVSLYAATKKSGELMAHSYSHLYALPTTGLRFFTVYGPWGRPDMSPSLFTRAIQQGIPIDVFNHGKMQRDFTYIDDIVEGIVRVLDQVAAPDLSYSSAIPDPGTSSAPYRLYNIGNHEPVELMTFIETIEKAIGKKAVKNMLPMQSGDVLATYADIDDLKNAVGFTPRTSLKEGIAKFVTWYQGYHEK